ncbi:unnamed protein product [Ixodes pacificus]
MLSSTTSIFAQVTGKDVQCAQVNELGMKHSSATKQNRHRKNKRTTQKTAISPILRFTITWPTVEAAAPLLNKGAGARHVITTHGRGQRGLVTTTAAEPSATNSSSRLLFLLTAIELVRFHIY